MSLRTIQRTLLHAPNQVASVASLTSAQAEEIFPTTQGAVHIDSISIGTLTTRIASNIAVINLQKPGGSPVYMTLTITEFKNAQSIPGFILPAGGLEAVSNNASPVSIDVFYETAE